MYRESHPQAQKKPDGNLIIAAAMQRSTKSYQNLIIGIHAVGEAIRAGKPLDSIFIQRGLKGPLIGQFMQLLKDENLPWKNVPIEKLNALSRGNHQGVAAFVSAISFANLEEIIAMTYEAGRAPRLLMLDGITDVRNFGAICRTAEAQGIDGVIIPEKGGAAINEDAVKTSAGALFHLPVCRVNSLPKTIVMLRERGIHSVACSEKASELIESVDLTGPVCLIMGSEDEGIQPAIIKQADALARIPMQGKTGSLNVSVATGMVIYEMNRQRGWNA